MTLGCKIPSVKEQEKGSVWFLFLNIRCNFILMASSFPHPTPHPAVWNTSCTHCIHSHGT